MKKGIGRRLRVSPALIVAMLALFVALTGTAVSASGLITGKQIKNSSITGLDVKNKSLTPKDFKGSVRGPRGLTGPKGDKGDKGDTGAPGAPGAAGAAGTARAYAVVIRTPSVSIDTTYVRGSGWAVTRPSTGVYCVTPPAGINPANTPAIVTIDWGNSSGFDLLAYWVKLNPFAPCTASQYHIRTYDFAAGGAPVLSDDVSFAVTIP